MVRSDGEIYWSNITRGLLVWKLSGNMEAARTRSEACPTGHPLERLSRAPVGAETARPLRQVNVERVQLPPLKSRHLTAAATWLAPARFERPSRARGRGVRDAAASDGAISDRLIQIGVVAALVGTLVQTSAHLTNAFLLDSRFDQLSAEVDWSIFSWASSVATFAGALAALNLAVAVPVRRRRFAFLAAALVFFSLDDIARARTRTSRTCSRTLSTHRTTSAVCSGRSPSRPCWC